MARTNVRFLFQEAGSGEPVGILYGFLRTTLTGYRVTFYMDQMSLRQSNLFFAGLPLRLALAAAALGLIWGAVGLALVTIPDVNAAQMERGQ